MKDFIRSLNRSDVSFSPVPDATKVDNLATGKALVFARKTDSDGLKLLTQKAGAVQKLWAAKTALERAGVLQRWYFLMKENEEELARIMTMEQGKSLTETCGKIDYAASFVRWSAEEARWIDGDVLTSVKVSQKLVVLKQPIGVTVTIMPWNLPPAMIVRKVVLALAVGCVMIVRPTSLTPLSVCALVVSAYEAGVSQNLLPVVSGSASEIGHGFATNPTVRRTSFAGSTEIGAKIFANSAADVKKLSLESGGNTPFIVFDDTDPDEVVEGALASKFRSSGQTCACTNRVYVQFGIYDEFCCRLSEKMAAPKLDNGLEEDVSQGPLIEKKAVEKVEQHIADVLAKGASCLTGGKRSVLGGALFEPTALSGVTVHMAVAREEIFGPLCPVFRFETETEVIAAANNTEYGLAAYLFTSDTARQWRVGEALECGMVGINMDLISNEVVPFSGVRRSGLGREGSKHGADEYSELKYLCTDVAE